MPTKLLAATLTSILTLTFLASLLRRLMLPRLCPLCAGVASTWMGLLAAHWAGFQIDLRLPAVLLGGSVVGLAGLGEVALTGVTPGLILVWKTIFVATGIAVAYALLADAWFMTALGSFILAALAIVPWLRARHLESNRPSRRPESIISQLKNCC